MLIINADDWGGWKSATDSAAACFQAGRISSATAMVFMEDSKRAAQLAIDLEFPVGLHLNLNQPFTGPTCPPNIAGHHQRVIRFLRSNKYAQLLYNPFLAESFRIIFKAQLDEFETLYGRSPTHIDGHQHMHLCANMLFSHLIPDGWKVRRSFSFWPGEKSFFNRAFRRCVTQRLKVRHKVTDHFFSLGQCIRGNRLDRVAVLSRNEIVELMTHPEVNEERHFLLSDRFHSVFGNVPLSSFKELEPVVCE